jgi:rhamnose transport system permease protein
MTRTATNPFGLHEVVLVLLLAAVLGVAAWLDPAFVAPRTQLDIASHALELALLALPMTLIIITGGIDLSVGSTMALASVVLGMLHQADAPVWVACAAALATGGVAGALNGFFVAKVRVHPLLITLATLAAYRGLAEGISRGRPMSGFPDAFLELGTGTTLGIPTPLILLVPAVLVAGLVASQTVWGSWTYAAGGNERAAEYCGIPVARLKFIFYTLSGLMASLGAVIFAARRNTAKADVGTGIELEVITAVVLGGTSIFGGRGTIIGTVLGVLIVHELREFVGWRWSHDEIILIVIGATLIGSVLIANLAQKPKA